MASGGSRGTSLSNPGTTPLVIRNTNVGVTNLGSGQALPITAQVAAAVQRLCGSSSRVASGVQVAPVQSVVPSKTMSVSCRIIDPSTTNAKNFMLRSIERSHFLSLTQLKKEIHRQLGSIVSSDLNFDVGYLQGQTRVCMHSEDDLKEVWCSLEKGNARTLWCEGVGLILRSNWLFPHRILKRKY
jgi:hypothetical protein